MTQRHVVSKCCWKNGANGLARQSPHQPSKCEKHRICSCALSAPSEPRAAIPCVLPFYPHWLCLQAAAYSGFTSSPLSMSCLLLWSRSLNIPTGRALVSSVLQVVALRQQISLLILESQLCWI